MMERPKSVIVLEALLEGQQVKFPNDEHTYMYLEDMLGVTASRTDSARPGWSEEVLLKVDLDITDFVKLCNKMSDEEVFVIGCAAALRRKTARQH